MQNILISRERSDPTTNVSKAIKSLLNWNFANKFTSQSKETEEKMFAFPNHLLRKRIGVALWRWQGGMWFDGIYGFPYRPPSLRCKLIYPNWYFTAIKFRLMGGRSETMESRSVVNLSVTFVAPRRWPNDREKNSNHSNQLLLSEEKKFKEKI